MNNFVKTRVYAVRNSITKERLSYRYRNKNDAVSAMKYMSTKPDCVSMEVYPTTQQLVRVSKKKL